MQLEQLRSLVSYSDPADWHKIGCWGAGAATSYRYALEHRRPEGRSELYLHEHHAVYVYRPDVNLTMARGLPLDHGETWTDEEISPGPKHDVRGEWLDMFWCGALVDRYVLYLVDGGRGVLPGFDRESVNTGQLDAEDVAKTVSARESRIARLAHCLGKGLSFADDERGGRGHSYYLRRSGIVVLPDGEVGNGG
jgi:hypothetical protein